MVGVTKKIKVSSFLNAGSDRKVLTEKMNDSELVRPKQPAKRKAAEDKGTHSKRSATKGSKKH